MSLKDFQTYLWPETKVGKIGFYQKPTVDNPNGKVLEADFSRPTTGATSGATVFRNGQLIELATNEPDWDDSSGCSVIKMRPQAENLVSNSENLDPTTSLWNIPVGTYTYDVNKLSPNSTLNVFTLGDTDGTTAIEYQINLGINSGGYNTVSFFIKKDTDTSRFPEFALDLNGGSDASCYLQVNTQTGATNKRSGAGTSTFEIIDYSNEYWKLRISVLDVNNTSSRIIIRPAATASFGTFNGTITGSVTVWGIQLEAGEKANDYIPTYGSVVTRSSNSFSFTDLVTKGVLGPNSEFSFLFYAPDSIGIATGNSSAGIWFYNDTNAIFNFWTNSGSSLRRPYKYAEGNGYIDFGNINYDQDEAILLTYNGQTIKFYDLNGLKGTFSFSAAQPINRILIQGAVFNFSLKPGYINVTNFEMSEAEAIAAIQEAQNL